MISARRLGPEDWEIWRGLRLRALDQAPEAFGTTLEEAVGADSPSHWRAALEGAMTGFVVEDDGVPAAIGRLLIEVDPDAPVELISVWVDPAHRGRGLGRALIAAALDHLAARRPGTRLRLAVVETNAPARRLYESCGFAVIGPNPEDDAELLMEHAGAR
ncbi:N-acetyltransferase [Brachybacterium endophyticum]|uniref:N-acetyltransferase n=1 Tax=Brachybacterium endophyticum TaxID=2182385 RepID=A0A2U2RP25_9MICO|nr:GNAT family N-acetyltransferase [Brachybacterium endophyticum]PWH07545.1 N-acetyltransferase [Brachybacterium endophyticum]